MSGHRINRRRTYRAMLAIVIHAALVAPLGCDDAEGRPTDRAASICAEASEHIAACLDASAALPTDCDTEAAQQLLETPCAALADPGKADVFDESLCWAGLLSWCEGPVCEVNEQLSEHPMMCGDYTAVEGCGSCDYYLCREETTTSCGDTGYYVGYGHKYCDRFSQVTFDRLSLQGQRWIDAVRTCLQVVLEEELPADATCDEIKEFAFDSHPSCYVESGFCDLSVNDLVLIVNTVDVTDFDFKQALVTGIQCLEGLFDPETLELTPEAIDRLELASTTHSSE